MSDQKWLARSTAVEAGEYECQWVNEQEQSRTVGR
jgi:hypothetical protein